MTSLTYIIFCFLSFKLKVSAGVSYRKLGCYKDNGQKKRPLPQLLFTDRLYLSPVYSGRKFIKESFDRSYLDDLVRRCASKCKQLGYDIFGIGKFGKGVNETSTLSSSVHHLVP